jgi:hypothetical protein
MDGNSACTRIRRLPAVAAKALVCAMVFSFLCPRSPSFAAAPDENQGIAEGNRAGPAALAREACLDAWAGDYDQAAKHLRAAIASHPDDAGRRYDPWTLPLHDKSALEHGQKQLEQILRDRPQMNSNLRSSDLLWVWAAAKFGEKIEGAEVDWDASPPSVGQTEADHLPPYGGQPGRIRVRKSDIPSGDPRTFETLWVDAVFELHNIEHAKEFARIEGQAFDGSITQDQFVKAMFSVERKTAERTRRWYLEIFLPHAKRYKIPTDPERWYCRMWGTADEEFAKLTDKGDYPWVPYSGYFARLRVASFTDRLVRLIVPFVARSGAETPPRQRVR